MTNFDDKDQTFPGLAPAAPRESDLERAARRTIARLHDLELLDERHALICQTVLEMAGSVADGRRSRRASAAAMAGAQLLAAIDRLPVPAERGDTDEWDRLVAEFRDAGSTPPARDQT